MLDNNENTTWILIPLEISYGSLPLIKGVTLSYSKQMIHKFYYIYQKAGDFV